MNMGILDDLLEELFDGTSAKFFKMHVIYRIERSK